MLQRLTDAKIFSIIRGLPSPASQPAIEPPAIP
jgi:hypothetical protein